MPSEQQVGESLPESVAGKIDKRRTPEFAEKARARERARWTPELRAEHGRLTREKMQAPGVKDRIRESMQRRAAAELDALRLAWRAASKGARARFLADLVRELVIDRLLFEIGSAGKRAGRQ